MNIKTATLEDLPILLSTLLILRPNLNLEKIKDSFKIQLNEGYQLIYIGDENMAFSIAGFRTLNFFFSGKTLYIDDLITHPDHTKNGYAGILLDWITDYAQKNNYKHISLDSGFHRKDAYRLYLNKGFSIESMHFGKTVV